jgi:hypothetical protein
MPSSNNGEIRMDEQEAIQNPETLLALVQQGVQRLIEQRPDTAEQEAQLRAVAKAIEQLEKQRVPVPDSLRQTKMDLVAKIGQQNQFDQQLGMLGDGLAEVLEMIEGATGKPRSEVKSQKDLMPRQHRPRSGNQETTPMSVLRDYILQSLNDLGGSAQCNEVLDRISVMLEGRFLPGDLEPHGNSGPTWRNRAQWERLKMVKEGILRSDSERGYWELAEK